MQAFPQPPAPRLDRHMEIGDGSCSVGSEVEVVRGRGNLLHLLNRYVESLHVHDTSTNIVMPPSTSFVSLKWCPMLDPVFPPEDGLSDWLETTWASDLLMARCIWSKGPPRRRFLTQDLELCGTCTCVPAQACMLETLHIIHCGSLRHVFALDNENKHGIKKNTN